MLNPLEPPPPPTIGFLDNQPGSLDGVFEGFAAAARLAMRTASALVLFFGDSHGRRFDDLARARDACRTRFGDVTGRGLVAAGHPPTRHCLSSAT